MDWRRKKYNFIEKKLILMCARLATKFADRIIVDSKYVAKFYQQNFNINPDYLPYGAEIINRSPSNKILKKFNLEPYKYFIFVGRFVPEKNLPILIRAFKKANLKDFKLVLVGRAIDPNYQQKIDSMKSPKIVMPGLIFGNEVLGLYKNSLAYVTASELEGTSPSLLQAMGASTAVIVNSIDENLETIGRAGSSYKYNNIGDLSQKLEKISKDKILRDQLARKSQKRIKLHYNWSKINKNYLELIKKIIQTCETQFSNRNAQGGRTRHE